jgi:hypothetical protein
MSELNDPDLRQELGRLAGPYPDDNVAFAAWQQRVVHVRRRRVVAWTTAAALSLVVGTVGVSALQSPGRHSLVPSKAGESSTEVSISTTADASLTTESTEPDTSEVTSLATDTTPNTEAVESSAPETDPASAEPPDGGTSTGLVSSSQPSIRPHSATHTFSAIGGSITVRQDGDRLTVVAINPAAGFRVDRYEHSDARVEVRFRSDNHESQITVKLEEGVMKHYISESSDNHDGGSDTSVAGDSSGGDHGDGGWHG